VIVQTLESLSVTFAERRRARRRRPAQGTVCRLTDAEGRAIGCGLVWNLSTTGISILLNLRLPPETRVGAELANADGDTLRLDLRVVHLKALRTGDFVIGGQFGRPLDEDELRPFVI
jgi:hypothetical protein